MLNEEIHFRQYKQQLLEGLREATADADGLITLYRNGDAMDTSLSRAMDELHHAGVFKRYIADDVSWHVELK